MKNIIFLITLICLTGCVEKVNNHGFVDHKKVSAIKEQESGKREVLQTLGSPSTISILGEENWYYISSVESSYAFFKPEIKEQNATVITFDKKGTVSDVKQYNLASRNNIEIVQDETSTVEKDMSVIEQLLGNVGRFNKSGTTTN